MKNIICLHPSLKAGFPQNQVEVQPRKLLRSIIDLHLIANLSSYLL